MWPWTLEEEANMEVLSEFRYKTDDVNMEALEGNVKGTVIKEHTHKYIYSSIYGQMHCFYFH